MFLCLTIVSMMQRNEGLVRGEPWPDVLGPNRISTSFSVVLPIFFNPTSAGPSLQMRGQPGLPGRPFLLYLGSCVLLKPPFSPVTQTNTTDWDLSPYGVQRVNTDVCFLMCWGRCRKRMKTVDDSDVSGIYIMGVSQSPNSGMSVGKYAYWDMKNLSTL